MHFDISMSTSSFLSVQVYQSSSSSSFSIHVYSASSSLHPFYYSSSSLFNHVYSLLLLPIFSIVSLNSCLFFIISLTLSYSSSSPHFTYTLTFNNRAIEEIEKNYGDFIYSPEIFNNDM